MKTTRVGGGHPGYVVRADPDPKNPDAPRPAMQQDLWHYTMARMVDACAATGCLPFYGPFGDIGDPIACEDQFRNAFLMGCVGAWSLHPSQIEIARRVFSPPPDEVAWARRVISEMGDGSGTVMIDGKMQDDATVKQCRVMVGLAKLMEGRPEMAAATVLEAGSRRMTTVKHGKAHSARLARDAYLHYRESGGPRSSSRPSAHGALSAPRETASSVTHRRRRRHDLHARSGLRRSAHAAGCAPGLNASACAKWTSRTGMRASAHGGATILSERWTSRRRARGKDALEAKGKSGTLPAADAARIARPRRSGSRAGDPTRGSGEAEDRAKQAPP